MTRSLTARRTYLPFTRGGAPYARAVQLLPGDAYDLWMKTATNGSQIH